MLISILILQFLTLTPTLHSVTSNPLKEEPAPILTQRPYAELREPLVHEVAGIPADGIPNHPAVLIRKTCFQAFIPKQHAKILLQTTVIGFILRAHA